MKTDKRKVDWQRASIVSWKSPNFPAYVGMEWVVQKEPDKVTLTSEKAKMTVDRVQWASGLRMFIEQMELNDRECVVDLYDVNTYKKQDIHDILELSMFAEIVSEDEFYEE